MKRLIPFLAALASTGCLDFAEPDLPDIGAPAILQVSINLRADGTFIVNGELAPGLTLDANTRRLPAGDSIVVYGVVIQPYDITSAERRKYNFGDTAAARFFDQPLTLEAPWLEDVRAVIRPLSWRTARRIGSDTIVVARGHDLVLPVAHTGTAHSVAPQREEWVLFLTTESQTYKVGANGPPPDSIVVPARWIPDPENGRVRLRLWHSMNTTMREWPGDYILNLSALIEVDWTLQLTGPTLARTDNGNESELVQHE